MTTKALRGKCVAKNRRGEPCMNWAVRGATVCRSHGAASPHVKAKAAVRAELFDWGLKDATEDPREILLRLVTQSASRCALYARLLEQAYDAAERLRAAHEAGATPEVDDEYADAKADLDRIFNTGGVAALVGNTYSAVRDIGIFATGEAIRGLADLEAKERDRCATFATKAVAAGLAERQVRLAERQGELFAQGLKAILEALNLTPEQQALVPKVMEAKLLELTG